MKELNYIDSGRVAVWGQGHGGHLALRVMTEDKDKAISCSVAVAPIAKYQDYGGFLLKKNPPPFSSF